MNASNPVSILGGLYYKTIARVQYDRQLLDKAEQFASNGNISYEEALRLLSLLCFVLPGSQAQHPTPDCNAMGRFQFKTIAAIDMPR